MESTVDNSGPKSFVPKRLFRFERPDRPFIVPTGFGVLFGAVVFVLFMIALSYQNNVVYSFVFFLASVAITAMIQTNSNVARVRFRRATTERLFAWESTPIYVEIENNSQHPCLQLFLKNQFATEFLGDIEAQHKKVGKIFWQPKKRGEQRLPRLTLFSSYPVGLLSSWREYNEKKTVVVFPSKRGTRRLPGKNDATGDEQVPILFREYRDYRQGDPVHRIDWKKSQKVEKTLVRNFEPDESAKTIQLSWDQTWSHKDFESRLSQLTLWVSEAEARGYLYSLSLPGWSSPMSRGDGHYDLCLYKLALFTDPQ